MKLKESVKSFIAILLFYTIIIGGVILLANSNNENENQNKTCEVR